MNTAVNQYNYRFLLTDYAMFDRNRLRQVAIYGRVSTEHEAQLSALENQLQWYEDQVRYHPNWVVEGRYIDEGITGTQAKKRPAFLRMIEDAKSGKPNKSNLNIVDILLFSPVLRIYSRTKQQILSTWAHLGKRSAAVAEVRR